MSKPRLPWTRGPVAWRLARRADEVCRRLAAEPRNFFSLRQAAALLGVSTQPVRDWIGLGHLQCGGPRGRVAKAELVRFVAWLRDHAKPFDPQTYTRRLVRRRRSPVVPFETLAKAHFLWPKGQAALTPRELAGLIGCHPSLVTQAIKRKRWPGLGQRRTPKRWEITRRAWQRVFPAAQVAEPTLPALPRSPDFSLAEAARHLGAWGVADATLYRVRCLAEAGELEKREPEEPGRGKWRITRRSLEKFRKKRLTRLQRDFSVNLPRQARKDAAAGLRKNAINHIKSRNSLL
jgi:hypothetical protein